MIEQDRQRHLRSDIAAFIGCPVTHLRLRPSLPRIVDHMDGGLLPSSVMVAIDSGTKWTERQSICILDLRAVMYGITWQFADWGMLEVDKLLLHFDDLSPEGFEVQLFYAGLASPSQTRGSWVPLPHTHTHTHLFFGRPNVAGEPA